MSNPYSVVADFEKEIAEYAGSKYAVAVESCTAAILLACAYLKVEEVTIPSRTYPSIPCSIIHAGGKVNFEDIEWQGVYQLKPYPIWDGAKRFYRGMYIEDSYHCLSFHAKKHLPIGRGGAILTNDEEAVKWFKLARFDGRHECSLHSDTFGMVGWNVYMTPEQASRGRLLMCMAKDKYEDMPEDPPYQDLSKYPMYTEANR
jgi:dTDP-4-amino-4,6-dideoxygalactose transaminase